MGRYASGNKTFGISDRSGFRYRLRDMKKEWNGLMVGPDEYEPKHPQLEAPNVSADPQAVRNPRPDIDEALSVYLFTNVVGQKTPIPLSVGRVGVVEVSVS